MKIKKQITVALMATTTALLFTGCFNGEGEVKIKAVSKQITEKGFFSDTYAQKPVEGLKVFIDDENMGITQQGFSSYTLDGGEHKISVELYVDILDENLYFNKNINVIDKSSTEMVFNLDEIKPIAKAAEDKTNRIDGLLSKYKLSNKQKFSRRYINRNGQSRLVEEDCTLEIENNEESIFSITCSDKMKKREGVNILEKDNILYFIEKVNTTQARVILQVGKQGLDKCYKVSQPRVTITSRMCSTNN